GGRDTEPALRVLGRVRIELRLLHVLDGDEADAVAVRIDDEKLFDAVLVKQALCLLLIDVLRDGDEFVLRHQLAHRLLRVRGKANVAVGEDADQLAAGVTAEPAVFDDGNAGNAVRGHQGAGIGQRGFGTDGDRVDHHPGLELLDLAYLLGLQIRRQVAVDDADAARLGHGDRQPRLGDRVHGRRQDRDVEIDVAGDAGRDVGFAGQHRRVRRLQKHVVEGQRLGAGRGLDDPCHACLALPVDRVSPLRHGCAGDSGIRPFQDGGGWYHGYETKGRRGSVNRPASAEMPAARFSGTMGETKGEARGTMAGETLLEPAAPALRLRREQFIFTGKAGEYFGIWIVNVLLTIVTLGIYSA